MPGWNFADVWEVVADTLPDAPSVVQGDRRQSWAETDRRANGAARALLDLGAGPQDKVAQYLYNCPEYLESVFGTFKAGLVPVNTNYRYGDDELAYLWDNADAVAVVFHGTFAERIDRLRPRLPRIKGWLWVDDGSGPCPDWAIAYEDAIKTTQSTDERVTSPWGRSADDGKDINLSAEVSQLLFRITVIGLFRVDPADWGTRPTELLAAALPYVGRRHSHPTIRAARSVIRELADSVIAQHRERGGDPDDLLSRLIASGGPEADPVAIRDHVVTLALAGYTTTASVVGWACYMLATRPDVAEQVRAELASVAPDRPLTLGDLSAVPYLTAVIKETMRLYPPAWIIGRRALRSDRIGDMDIPPDSVVAISPYVLHRHPTYWPEPEVFEPRRFLDEEGERTRKPYSYIPFGAGPRSCIGANFALAEAPLIVGLLVQRYRMTLPNDVHVRPYGIFVLTPRPPIRTFLTSIHRN